MDSHNKEIFGSLIAAIGTIQSAIGSTPLKFISSDFLYDLRVWGNVLQATGNGLEADGQGTVSFELIGDEIQSIGNLTVITGLLIDFQKKADQKLIITGNWLQALGGLVGLVDEFEDSTESGRALNIVGNLLQSIGNSMQAVGGVYQLEKVDKRGELHHLGVWGSWIQAVGSVIALLGQIKEETEEIERNINE